MGENVNIGDLILRGGVIGNVDADTPFEVYEQIKTKIKFPLGIILLIVDNFDCLHFIKLNFFSANITIA